MAQRRKDMPRSTPLWLRITVMVLLCAVLLCSLVFAALAIIHAWAANL